MKKKKNLVLISLFNNPDTALYTSFLSYGREGYSERKGRGERETGRGRKDSQEQRVKEWIRKRS